MYVTNITDDFDNITYNNCTDNEYNIHIILPVLLFTIQCGLSFLCLLSIMIYTLIKPLFKFK